MTSPSQPEQQPSQGHKAVLADFIRRLNGAISRSSLLKVRLSKTGKLLDSCRLEQVAPGLSNELLEAILDGEGPVPVQLELQALDKHGGRADAESLFAQQHEDDDRLTERVALEHAQLHKTFERMSRDAELVKRETGRHALWLGYPLLYAAAGEGDILAPVFLWPISIRFDYRHQGRVLIAREGERKAQMPPQFNRAMAAWLHRQLAVQLPEFSEAELSDLDMETVESKLRDAAARFHPTLAPIACKAPLEPIPQLKALDPHGAPRFYHSAVLGYFRWQNEAILADSELIRSRNTCPGVFGEFVSGVARAPTRSVAPPPEEDRFLVYDADWSQEQVVWQARTEPGLVVHGPPGTGKSQTIVNIVADALAHDRTVLMVCQKQAATRVVLERLRAAGLADLCLEVLDAAADRLDVFKEIRSQADSMRGMSTSRPQSGAQEARARLSREIAEKEALLDQHARAFHEQDSRIGLSYRQMTAREARLLATFRTVRELPELRQPLAGLSSDQVREINRHVRTMGVLFKTADPLHNPWRCRRPTFMGRPAERADVTAALKDLRVRDEAHSQQVNRQGAGGRLPVQVAEFISVASALAHRLRRLQESASLLTITGAWLKIIRAADDAGLGLYQLQCEHGVLLAKQVATTGPDPQWAAVCQAMTGRELKQLRASAQMVANQKPRWWTFLDVRRWRANRAIRRLRPDAAENLGKVARSLLAHLSAQQAREDLTTVTNSLLSALKLKAGDGASGWLPERAKEGLEMASWFRQQEQCHDWLRTPVQRIAQDRNP
jgi:hypothetical protein